MARRYEKENKESTTTQVRFTRWNTAQHIPGVIAPVDAALLAVHEERGHLQPLDVQLCVQLPGQISTATAQRIILQDHQCAA